MEPVPLNISIALRPAAITDLRLLQHWDKQPHVIAADPNDYWAWETELQNPVDWREQLIAELNDRPVGFIQIIDPALEETHYWGEIERCFANPNVHTIWIDPLESNKDAIRFYERMGFKFVEKRRFGEDECAVYRIKRKDWK